MEKIRLRGQYSNRFVLVDDADFPHLSKFRWYGHTGKRDLTVYAATSRGAINGGHILMHRLLFGLQKGDNVRLDHIDGNGLNNQKYNLRVATYVQNGSNRRGPESISTSGIRGVSWHKNAKKWRAQIKVRGQVIHLGMFNSIASAINARQIAGEHYHGEFRGKLSSVGYL